MKFTEENLEQAIIDLVGQEDIPHLSGDKIVRDAAEVLIKEDLKKYLVEKYSDDHITSNEIDSIIRKLDILPHSDLYDSNKSVMKMVSDGFLLKREDRNQKDLFIQLIDYSDENQNIYKVVNQLEIQGYEKRIP